MIVLSYFFVATAAIFIIANVIALSALKDKYAYNVHIYSYFATVSVGVEGRVSQFNVEGRLKTQRDVKSDKYMMSLFNVTLQSYYGEEYLKRRKESKSLDDHVLTIPFYVIYDESGMFKSIEYSSIEPEWSQNIKKSIATLLQINWPIVYRGISNEGSLNEHGIEETTIHGKCKVNYKMSNHPYRKDGITETELGFSREYEPYTCDEFVDNFHGYLTNDKWTKKTLNNSSKWSDYSGFHNYYKLFIYDGVPKFTIASSREKYIYNDNIDDLVFIKDNRPLRVDMRQQLVLLDKNSEEIFFKDLPIDKEAKVNKTDDASGFINRIIDLLVEAHNYMGKDHLEVIIRGEEHRQLFNKILSSLKRLKLSDFVSMESKILENPNADQIRNILVQILPYVGTECSLQFIRDIITLRKISDELAIDLLTILPIHAERSMETVDLLKNFIIKKCYHDDTQGASPTLSQKVCDNAVASLSHILNSIPPNIDPDVYDRSIREIISIFFWLDEFKGHRMTASKLIVLAAIGNIREPNAVNKYTLPILSSILTNNSQDHRLRLAAINILSELISQENGKIWDNLLTILYNKTEYRSIRSATYDLITSRSDYAIDSLNEIGIAISNDKDLYNYHFSTIEALLQVGILDGDAKIRLNKSEDAMTYSLSRTVILKTNEVFKSELLKSTLKINSIARTYIKLSFIYNDQLRTVNWQIPSLVKCEILEREDEKFTLNKAIYFHTNFNGLDTGEEVYFDTWMMFIRNLRIYYVDSIEFEKLPSLLDLSDIILKKIHDKLHFTYKELTTMSISTGLGIDAVFEHKYPSLVSMLVNYNWESEDNCLEAKADFSLRGSSSGYSGVSIFNPFSGLTHSIRKTQLLDTTLSFSVIVKYNFMKRELNFTVPVFVKESDKESKQSGFALYTSTSVGITDADDEISCENCGFKIAAEQEPVSLHFRRSDYFGVLASYMPYNCDLRQKSLDIKSFVGQSDDDNVVSSCGFIAMIMPNASKPFSQIELLLNFDAENLKDWEKSWYFLPGYKLDFKLLIGTRQIVSNNFKHELKLDVNASSSQGHFSNVLQFKFVKRNNDHINFVLCFDGKVDFPEIDDNHLPIEITQSKLNAFSRVVVGQSFGESCCEVDSPVDFNLTGEVSEAQKITLENYAFNSECAKQKTSSLYVYPRGLYPLTEDCIGEMLSNTTLRRYRLDLTSEKFSDVSLLQALLIFGHTRDKVKELATNSHNANVELQMISPLSEIRTSKQMSFQVDYPVPNVYKNLPNIYFSQDFTLGFIDKRLNVINVYPKIIVYNNEEKPFPTSNGWNEIYTGVSKTSYKIYANVLPNDKISLKILFKTYELILKPKLVSVGTIDSSEALYASEIVYNQQLFNEFEHRLHLFTSQEILFSLSRVDDYVVIRSTKIPVTVYYTTSSITIFQNK